MALGCGNCVRTRQGFGFPSGSDILGGIAKCGSTAIGGAAAGTAIAPGPGTIAGAVGGCIAGIAGQAAGYMGQPENTRNPLMEAQIREAQVTALDKQKKRERTAWMAVGVGAGAIVLGTIAYFALKGR